MFVAFHVFTYLVLCAHLYVFASLFQSGITANFCILSSFQPTLLSSTFYYQPESKCHNIVQRVGSNQNTGLETFLLVLLTFFTLNMTFTMCVYFLKMSLNIKSKLSAVQTFSYTNIVTLALSEVSISVSYGLTS